MNYSTHDLFADDCPAERQALFGLAAVAVSDRVPVDLANTLAESDPLVLAKDAQRMQVHTLIGPVLTRHSELAKQIPDDLVLFFRAMHASNRQRAAEGLSQLKEIGAELNARDIPAVVLKGGGDLLSPIHADSAIRYVGDLDILVPIDRAEDALATALSIGATFASPPVNETSRFDWRGQRLPEHHLPRLVRADWTFPIEIHVHLGSGAVADVLDAAETLDQCVPAAVRGLAVPSSEDRACHLVTHTTRHNGIVDLRAWVDWCKLRRHCDRAVVERRLSRAGYGQMLATCDLMADLLEAANTLRLSRKETTVARKALCTYCATGNQSVVDVASFFFRRGRGLVLSSSYRAHIAERLFEPGFVREILSRVGRRGSGRR
ncbi:nucleotidyltransferase family protein [Aliiruegeria lutimaris]|uniref:Uncharacterized nucleotidyltransferase n=1 Tax=Aliiruegeria lutimaris TaxID=571298 RepID=A0A1G9PIP5_9RHOB|nr:nucleotidyltransferase family protein [Aliiruegeria lutimaris]SDL98650.1 Uncharacterised nucleotidyltransferase [Aliiruegeria lutimaris]